MSEWKKIDNKKLYREFKFRNFMEAITFVNKIGTIAEVMNHHPDIQFGWGYANVSITTHDEGGLTEKDQQLADKIDAFLANG